MFCRGFPKIPLHTRPPPPSSTTSGRPCARPHHRQDALHWETCVFCKVINLAAGSVGGAGQASSWVSVQECHVAWGPEAPVRTLDFIIMTCVTLGTCPSLQTMWQTQNEKGFQGQILGRWAERARHMLSDPGLWVGLTGSACRGSLSFRLLLAGGAG